MCPAIVRIFWMPFCKSQVMFVHLKTETHSVGNQILIVQSGNHSHEFSLKFSLKSSFVVFTLQQSAVFWNLQQIVYFECDDTSLEVLNEFSNKKLLWDNPRLDPPPPLICHLAQRGVKIWDPRNKLAVVALFSNTIYNVVWWKKINGAGKYASYIILSRQH